MLTAADYELVPGQALSDSARKAAEAKLQSAVGADGKEMTAEKFARLNHFLQVSRRRGGHGGGPGLRVRARLGLDRVPSRGEDMDRGLAEH